MITYEKNFSWDAMEMIVVASHFKKITSDMVVTRVDPVAGTVRRRKGGDVKVKVEHLDRMPENVPLTHRSGRPKGATAKITNTDIIANIKRGVGIEDYRNHPSSEVRIALVKYGYYVEELMRDFHPRVKKAAKARYFKDRKKETPTAILKQLFVHNGEIKTGNEWALERDLNIKTVASRIMAGHTEFEKLFAPVRPRGV